MSDPIDNIDTVDPNKSDFVSVGGNVLQNINIKVAVLLLIIGMILFSDIFIDGVLAKINGTVHGECTTTKGTMIQLIMLVLSYIVIDLLVQSKII
jgi:hypothetical protein